MNMLEKRIIQAGKPLNVVLIAPSVARMPLPIQRYDDPFLPFGKAVIQTTRDLVSMYIVDVMAYFVLGGAGAVALERTIDYLNDEVPVILHAPFATTAAHVLLDKLSFGADGFTLRRGDETIIMLNQADVCGTLEADSVRLGALTLQLHGNNLIYSDGGMEFQQTIRRGLLA